MRRRASFQDKDVFALLLVSGNQDVIQGGDLFTEISEFVFFIAFFLRSKKGNKEDFFYYPHSMFDQTLLKVKYFFFLSLNHFSLIIEDFTMEIVSPQTFKYPSLISAHLNLKYT